MLFWTIVYALGLFMKYCYGNKEYSNDCGTVTVSQPVIDGKHVLFTFIPTNWTYSNETEVTWFYKKYSFEQEVVESFERYVIKADQSGFTLDLGCDKRLDKSRNYLVEYATNVGDCRSPGIKLDILDAPRDCGILYRQPGKIDIDDTVILEYYAPDAVLESLYYVRSINRYTRNCTKEFGCHVNQTWYTEEYRDYNKVYIYRIHNFTSDMNGNYTLQCTNRTYRDKVTNPVRLVIPVPPSNPEFLDTVDVGECKGCIAVKESSYLTVHCEVTGGTRPVTVNMYHNNANVACTMYETDVCCWELGWIYRGKRLFEVRCEVSNEATEKPLVTKTKIYVVTQPSWPHLKNSQQMEGKAFDIGCKSEKGQPVPELRILVNGSVVNTTASQTVLPPDQHILLSSLHRDWHGMSIQCCMTHPYYDCPKCTDTGTVNYLFPPELVEISTLTTTRATTPLTTTTTTSSDEDMFTQSIQCSVINANPKCWMRWTYPRGLPFSIVHSNVITPTGRGGYTTTSILQFNGTIERNGGEIYCLSTCDKFVEQQSAKYDILLPYPPTMTFNTSKETQWNSGDPVAIQCHVDTHPIANISWLGPDNITMATVNCGDNAECIRIDKVQMADAGNYSCVVETEFFGVHVQTVELTVKPATRAITEDERNTDDDKKTVLPWIIVGTVAAGVVLLLVVAVAVVVKRKKQAQGHTGAEAIPMDNVVQHDHYGKQVGPVDSTYDNDNSEDNIYVNNVPDADDVSPPDDTTEYAVAIPKSQRQTMDKTEKQQSIPEQHDQHKQHNQKELVYADLDLPTEGIPPDKPVIRKDSQTEYGAIDFGRVGEPLQDTCDENIYANQ